MITLNSLSRKHRAVQDKRKIGTIIAEDFGRLLEGPSGSFIQRIGDSDMLLSYEYIQDKNWYIVSIVPKETLLATMGNIRKIGGFMLAINAVLIALYVRLFAVRVVTPIGEIADGFKNFQLNLIKPGWRMQKPKSLKQIADLVMWFNAFLESMEKRQESDIRLRIAATAFESHEGMFITGRFQVPSATGLGGLDQKATKSKAPSGRKSSAGHFHPRDFLGRTFKVQEMVSSSS